MTSKWTDEKYRKTELEKGEDINSDPPCGAAGHFDQKLSVLDVGPVFPTHQRLTERR